MYRSSIGLAVLLAALIAGTVDAQPPALDDNDYRIGPGDRLSVSVVDASELGTTVRVSNSGKIHLPHLGIFSVNGMTITGLERHIASQLRERGFVKEAWVSVRIEEYRAQPVYILGEVIMPGQFVIKNEMHLIDLITLAQGFNEVASPIGYLYRRRPNAGALPPGEAPTDEAIPIDFDALNEGANPDLNVRLRGGDVLYVPQRRVEQFFLIGEVNAPGAFPVEKNLPVTRAIAIAGGTLRSAKLSKAVIVRFDLAGARQEIPVDLAGMLKGRKQDVIVQADDIVFVPGSRLKTVSDALFGVIPGTLTAGVQRGLHRVVR